MKTLVASLTLFLLSIAAIAQELQPVVVQNLYQPKPGKEDEVYQWRLHASEVRRKLGLPEGRVLKKVSGEGAWLVAWECDYPSMAAREADVKALDRSDEFTRVQEHMGTLIQKFERNIWEIGDAGASSDEAQIRKNRFASNEAIKAHDTAGIARHWTKDISVVTSRNVHNVGKKQNATAFATEFAAR